MVNVKINYYGFNPPFFGGHQNVLSRQAGERLIRNDLRQLINTMFGERLMRPKFGTSLRGRLFEEMTDAAISDIQAEIAATILKEEPRIAVGVAASADSQNKQLTLTITGYFTGFPNRVFEDEIIIPLGNTTTNAT